MLTLLTDVRHVCHIFHYQLLVVLYIKHVHGIDLIQLINEPIPLLIRPIGLQLQMPRLRHRNILRQTLLLPRQPGAQIPDDS